MLSPLVFDAKFGGPKRTKKIVALLRIRGTETGILGFALWVANREFEEHASKVGVGWGGRLYEQQEVGGHQGGRF